jgi:anthranilate phosphoribosyltransferase
MARTDSTSACHDSYLVEWTGTTVVERELSPETLGLHRHAPAALLGGAPDENATILRAVLGGRASNAVRDAVAINAAAAFEVTGLTTSLAQGLAKANSILASGAGLDLLERLATLSKS